jgi:hypothetical protein
VKIKIGIQIAIALNIQILGITNYVFAQDQTTQPTVQVAQQPVQATPQATTEPKVVKDESVKGLMAGGQISNIFENTGLGLGIRYWDEYIGGDFLFGFQNGVLETSSGKDVVDQTSFGLAAGILGGIPMQFAKPHLRLGFLYAYSDENVSSVKVKEFDLVTSLGCDFRASKHLLLGVDFASFNFILMGDISGTDVDGYHVALLNGIRIAYIF